MGDWGYKPWENDAAADWFNKNFKQLNLPAAIDQVLEKEVDHDTQFEIRGAISLLIFLGRPVIYPSDKLNEHLSLALEKLNAIKALWATEYDNALNKSVLDPHYVSIDCEAKIIRHRLADPFGKGLDVHALFTPEEANCWLSWS